MVVLATLIQMIAIPYRRPTNMVKNHIFRITPIGTSIEDVIELTEIREDWRVRRIDLERGFIPGTFGRAPSEPDPNIIVIGEKSIIVSMGTYRAWYKWVPFLLDWNVSVFWGFDKDGKLIDVQVQKLGMP
jgi:hypothetical protein